MLTGAYRPTCSAITLDDESEATAFAFVAEPRHPLYERDESVPSTAPLVAAAGPLRSNADCVFRLKAVLAGWAVTDERMEALVETLLRVPSTA
jgi:cation transport protein ChaC